MSVISKKGLFPTDGTHISARKGSLKSSQKILELITGNPSITAKQLAVELGISKRAIKKHLHSLKAKNLIRRIGLDKGGHWEIVGSY